MVLSDSLAGTLEAFPSPPVILAGVFLVLFLAVVVSLLVASRGRRP